jgi:hypothetical protein
MPTYTRTETDLIGTFASPATIAASASSSGTLSMTGSSVADAAIGVVVTIGGSAPTTNPIVQFSYTLDGTNYIADGGPYVVPIGTTSTSYSYKYDDVPRAAKGIKVTVTNGATNGITCFAQGNTLGVS